MKITFLGIFVCFFVSLGIALVPKSDENQARLISPKVQNEEGIKFKEFQIIV